jgi:hypothetical protein
MKVLVKDSVIMYDFVSIVKGFVRVSEVVWGCC